MKTVTHKLLITIMAVLLVISVAFTFVACAKQGEKGEKGDVGQNGADGVGIADVKIDEKGQLVITYTDGKVQTVGDVVGKDGKDGKSAYEIYVEDYGYMGSQTQWLYDLANGKLSAQYPVRLSGDAKSFTYGFIGEEKTVAINEKNFYVDGRLSDAFIADKDYVFNTFNAALEAATDGTEEAPMNIFMAPYVYWTHDPDSEKTEQATLMTKSCANLHITGLTDDARNVVIAMNYGHNEGYDGGNPTMLNISGDGLTLKNFTIGGFCNVDLDYPLNPSLSRVRRTDNVTQCQIASYGGDKLFAKNVRFVSRLNMMPFISSKRALYVDCHLESTDDSLNGSSKAVYLNCDFEFYSGKPWGGSSGVTLLNCEMKGRHTNVGAQVKQYLSKGAGRFNLIDCRFTDDYKVPATFGWSDILSDTFRSYYSNVTRNGEQIHMEGDNVPEKAVDITGTEFLKAYKLVDENGNVVYNVYNLLRGTDEWDPLGQKETVTALGAADVATEIKPYLEKTTTSMWGQTYVTYVDTKTLETGKEGFDEATVQFEVGGPQDTDYTTDYKATFKLLNPIDAKYVTLTPSEDGKTCLVKAINEQEETAKVIIEVIGETGIEGAIALTVKPSMLPAPTFTTAPEIKQNGAKAELTYKLDLGEREDMSLITWYLCDAADSDGGIQIAIGRTAPLKEIAIAEAYVGKYLRVEILPKHIRCEYGDPTVYTCPVAVTADGVSAADGVSIDVKTFATARQAQIIPGMWTLDAYCPADTQLGYIPLDGNEVDNKYSAKVNGKWTPANITENNSWAYAIGHKNGFLGYEGIYHTQRGARMMYTPKGSTYGDMNATIKLAPGKTAAQGFGSDYQYMDIMIKFDTTTLTGYGVRIYRTSGSSCAAVLMEHKDGKSKEICAPVNGTFYLTEVTVRVWTEGNTLNATIKSSSPNAVSRAEGTDLQSEANLTATIAGNQNGGFCLINTGTLGDNTTYVGGIELNWK